MAEVIVASAVNAAVAVAVVVAVNVEASEVAIVRPKAARKACAPRAASVPSARRAVIAPNVLIVEKAEAVVRNGPRNQWPRTA